ncbi:MAG: GNAT family N-acetyltransferase [Armatimonadetes bacterium]|nr:GNAT family N-acetyltransferase [Armatimonadota bacterium]
MLELVYLAPAEYLHTTDLPYRFASWAFDCPENIALWEDERGELLGWAVLQTPFWTIDYATHPNAPNELRLRLLEWADARAEAIRDTASGHPCWFVNVLRYQGQQIRDLEALGFASQEHVPQYAWSKALLKYTPSLAPLASSLPPGFRIRPLSGVSEVAAYVALHREAFQSESMTEAWRQRTFQHSAYQPDLDIVVEAEDGRMVGFCICWFAPNEGGTPTGRVEPMGVSSEFHRIGLGKALLIEGIRRLQERGAAQVFVECDLNSNYPTPAFALYESVGFRVFQEVLVYRKNYI